MPGSKTGKKWLWWQVPNPKPPSYNPANEGNGLNDNPLLNAAAAAATNAGYTPGSALHDSVVGGYYGAASPPAGGTGLPFGAPTAPAGGSGGGGGGRRRAGGGGGGGASVAPNAAAENAIRTLFASYQNPQSDLAGKIAEIVGGASETGMSAIASLRASLGGQTNPYASMPTPTMAVLSRWSHVMD